MKLKNLWLIMPLTLFSFFPTYADSSVIHYFPISNLTLCKGCGHSHSDIWRGKFRIENLSDKDLVLYGDYFDNKFSPGGMIQRRNPDLCEWQYGNGKSKDIEWSKKSSLDKNEFILKSKQSIEFESYFDDWSFNKPTRFIVYAAEHSGADPKEFFSDAFTVKAEEVLDANGKLLDYEHPVFSSINESCDPNCKFSIEQSPSVRGIKLGMTFKDFRKQFPKVRVSKSKEKNYQIKLAWLWQWNEEAYDVEITFLDDKVAEVETKFRSLENAREKSDFYSVVAGKLGLANFWTPGSLIFECRDFLINVLSNAEPTITISTKKYIEVRDQINEEALKKHR